MLHVVGRSHPGGRGGPNQDSIGWDESHELALVADGMGGYAGGEIASGLVKQTLLQSAGELTLQEAILSAHEKIASMATEHPDYDGMGSTVVSVQVVGGRCRYAWVGDSRAYLWRRGALLPLTRDHSVVEILRTEEELSETQVREHPLRHKVLQSLGKDSPQPSLGETPLRRGDWLLLCSDGLSGELRDEEIARVLGAHKSIDVASDALLNDALAKGASDDVSVVIAEYDGPSQTGFAWQLNERAILWLSVAAGVVLAALVTGFTIWLGHKK